MGTPVRAPDPYTTLGVTAAASDAEVRAAFRRLALRHHPDHNGGSPQAGARFAEIQEAYAHIRVLRRGAERAAGAGADDPGLDARLADMEADLRRAREDRERTARRAERFERLRRRPAERPPQHRPRADDAELGYVRTEDSFTKIFDDLMGAGAADAEAGPTPPRRSRSVADWIDELGTRLTGEDRGGD